MTAPKLEPAGGPVLQFALATLPLLALLVFFLYVASRRPSSECYSDNADASNCGGMIRLVDMAIVFLVFALLWGILAAYLSFFVRKRHALVRKYLKEGRSTLGDVFYDDSAASYCGSLVTKKDHFGYVQYSHPRSDVYPVFIRKKVRLLQKYTREQVTILMLPDKPLSGQPKEDLELDMEASQRNSQKFFSLAAISWLWLLFTALAPIYIILILEQVGSQPNSLEYVDSGLAWIIYAVSVGVIIPAVSFGANMLAWKRHEHFMTASGKIAEEDEKEGVHHEAGWTESHGSEEAEYAPPTISKSSDATSMATVEEE